MSVVFRCDVCGVIEDQKTNSFKFMDGRSDLCKGCYDLLSKCADLLKKPGFKEQLVELHVKFFGEGNT